MTRQEEDQNGFYSSEHGVTTRDKDSLPFRMAQSEHALRELEKFSDELRLAKQLHDEQISNIRLQSGSCDKDIDMLRVEQMDTAKSLRERITKIETDVTEQRSRFEIATTTMRSNLETSIANMRTELNTALALVKSDLNASILDVRASLDTRIESVNTGLSTKFDENKNYFSRWFLALSVGLIISMLVIIATRVITNVIW